jgi:hypothetical protein
MALTICHQACAINCGAEMVVVSFKFGALVRYRVYQQLVCRYRDKKRGVPA